MATYVYRCIDDELHGDFEVSRPITEPEPKSGYKCKECNSTMVRQYTPFGIQFKGSGFYKTDNG